MRASLDSGSPSLCESHDSVSAGQESEDVSQRAAALSARSSAPGGVLRGGDSSSGMSRGGVVLRRLSRRRRDWEAMSDRELFAAVSEGHAEAMGVLAGRHEKAIRFVMSRWVDRPEDVDDLWQDTLFKAQRAATTFRGQCAPGTWLHRIAVNTAKDFLRRRGRAEEVALDDATLPASASHAYQGGLRAALVTALDELDEPFRTTFLLVDLYGFSVLETASRLGISPGTVKSRCSRARRFLRAALDDEA
ncbi:RNA polymerase sigma factor [Corynebacterium kroppenstedtii]|uniref:RNA polymerase sigma factor n=1 Tax=Corynebacterium sp. PCR 32 TaxID=3351342 RepID=UPI0030B2C3C7